MTIAPKRVAVLGGGVMGTGIAALMANNGIPVDIFDVKKEFAENSIKKMADKKAKIPILYSARRKKLVGAYSLDEIAQIAEADLIVEAVPEVLSIKQSTYEKVDAHRKAGSIICTNTSGLSVNAMVEGRSDDFQKNFIGTHFFNPVRFMSLVEIIPAKTTREELSDEISKFMMQLGKKPLPAFDTPNFIANRIGNYAFLKALELMQKYGFNVEQVDMITGSPIGAPKTGTFRLADLVGIDVLMHVAQNSYDSCVNDECRDTLKAPDFMKRLVEEKKLGDKTGGGFYRKSRDAKGKRVIEALDLETWEYRPSQKPKADSVRVAKKYVSAADRVVAMVTYGDDDPYSNFARELVLATAAYSLNRVGEAAADVASVDNALKWGFSRDIGPIEVLDAIGLDRAAKMMQDSGIAVPQLLKDAIDSTGKFYEDREFKSFSFKPASKSLEEDPKRERIRLDELRAQGKVVRENLNARMIDLGDGILNVEFDCKMVPTMNPIDDFVLSILGQVFEVVNQGFRGVVIGNQGKNFSAGAQLMMILELAKRKRFKDIEMASGALQMVALNLKHAPFPVVTAPHGMTLGGGLEVTLAGHKVVAAAETYAGLVEAGVGLIPGGAGCMMLTRQLQLAMAKRNPGPMPAVVKAFELIGMAQVSKSGEDAVGLGMINKDSVIVVDKDMQLTVAKEECIKMTENFEREPSVKLHLPGKGGYHVLADQVDSFLANGTITPHSATIGKKLAWVLTGGDKASPIRPLLEHEFLENERQAFLELCGEKLSQDRMKYMLKNGKPLLN